MYSVFRSSTCFSSCVIQTERWLKAADTQTIALDWIKEASVTPVDTSFDGRLL